MTRSFKHTPLMVLGTSSGSGKSLMVAAICRVLMRRGEFPVPFKGQNMSNNAWVDENGGEMAYSQAFQAWAAGVIPECSMNPVLLKPRGDHTSEVIHLGKSVGISNADTYYEKWFLSGWRAIRSSINQIISHNNDIRFILEGAGSPVEINLQRRDLTNIRLAQYLNANCLLVADIERGGVFAQIIGTLELLRPIERKLIKGILINRFRGRRELFEDGRRWLESKTGIPVVGVLPWLNELFPAEDTLDLINRTAKNKCEEIEVAVVRLKSISNFSDFDPLEAEPTVNVRWLEPGMNLGRPDVVLLPGSKQTMSDLKELKNSFLYNQIKQYVEKGGSLFGICGGFQMLGSRVNDPLGIESNINTIMHGLNFIPISTTFANNKKLEKRDTISLWPIASNISGFEIHHGSTVINRNETNIKPLFKDESLGYIKFTNQGGFIAGTYLHGIFDNGRWRRLWLNSLRLKKGLALLETDQPNFSIYREKLIDTLADAFEQNIDLDKILI